LRRWAALCERDREATVQASSIATLDAVVDAAVLALFESVGISLERATPPDHSEDNIGATIGFTSATLRGSVILISTRDFVARALPKEVPAGTGEEQLSDWTGELANQLLGRIKNKLLGLGVTLEMSTPAVIWGLELATKSTRSRLRRRFTYAHDGQPLSVFVDVVAAPDFEFTPSGAHAPGIAEGELTLF
jgi:CheY-specific phosphatase CheX